MIVHTSALMAVLLGEAEHDRYSRLMHRADTVRLSGANALELTVVSTRGHAGKLDTSIERLLDLLCIRIEPVTSEQAALAREAYRTFGQGTGHPARLNFGDCFAYALAKAMGEPLLFKGEDFAATDVAIAA